MNHCSAAWRRESRPKHTDAKMYDTVVAVWKASVAPQSSIMSEKRTLDAEYNNVPLCADD